MYIYINIYIHIYIYVYIYTRLRHQTVCPTNHALPHNSNTTINILIFEALSR